VRFTLFRARWRDSGLLLIEGLEVDVWSSSAKVASEGSVSA